MQVNFKIDEKEYKDFVIKTNEKIKMWNRVVGVGERKITPHPY